jgi:hypothetical protein
MGRGDAAAEIGAEIGAEVGAVGAFAGPGEASPRSALRRRVQPHWDRPVDVRSSEVFTMNEVLQSPALCGAFELRFQSLFVQGRSLGFPCDERGRVDLDALGVHARQNYLYARALVGRDYAIPVVVAVEGETAGQDASKFRLR